MLGRAQPFLPSRVVGAATWQARAATTGAQVDVLRRQLVASDATRLQLVGEPTLLRGVQKVLALRSEKEMVGVDALSVIAAMADHSSADDRAVVNLPRIAVSGNVVAVPRPSVPTNIQKARPLPTVVRHINLAPEIRGVIHTDQDKLSVQKTPELCASWFIPKRSGT